MAEHVMSFVVERLGDFLIEETKFIHGVSGKVKQIYDELRWMKAFLQDADNKQDDDQRIRVWVADVRTLAYDAGDVLESFLLGVDSKRVGGIKNIVKRYICILNECVDLHMVGSEIQNIQSRISRLKSSLETYGIRSLPEVTSSTQQKLIRLRRTYSHTVEDDFVGFEEDLEELVEHLVNNGVNSNSLVSICGLGGSGKSSIARKVYNHTRVKRRFEAFAWICVSQEWQTSDILQQILTKLIPHEKDENKKLSDSEMIKKLFEVQSTKSCLIVLDDIWNKDAWDCIKAAFPKENTKSKLLITSRNKAVAIHVNSGGFLYEPRALSEEESWVLLKTKTFSKNVHHYSDQKDLEEMEKLGMEMVKQCKGLPLGIVVLGGILATKSQLSDWKDVHRNIKSVIRRGETRGTKQEGVSRILELSYNDLPYYLKPCFLYLSRYKEDAEINAEMLYQFWMAESMVLSDDKRECETMMDVAESYLGELAQRSMLQLQSHDEDEEYQFKRFRSCRMHDMVRDLCLSKSKEEDFFHNNIDLDTSSSMSNARRVAIYLEGDNGGGIYVSTYSRRLQSLLILKDWNLTSRGRLPRIVKSHLSEFKLLRTLAIENFCPTKFGFDSIKRLMYQRESRDYFTLPNAIGSLIHLRYLSIKDSSFIMFPTCIKKLKLLQTLNLGGCEFLFFTVCMENVLGKMTKLQHLYLPHKIAQSVRGNKLMLDKSINLEILENYDPSYCRNEDLMKLTNLRKFSATVTSNYLKEAKEIISYLSSNTAINIRHASLELFDCDFQREEWQIILTKVMQSSCVHILHIYGGISIELPRYNNITTLSSRLTVLFLVNSGLKEDPMPILEAFPNLVSLTLLNAFQGMEMICSSNGFPSLRSLRIQYMNELESFKLENGAMPRLHELQFRRCYSMKTIPDGLRFITTLQTLRITLMPGEFREKAEAVKNGEKGEDFQKIGHVPYIIIEK